MSRAQAIIAIFATVGYGLLTAWFVMGIGSRALEIAVIFGACACLAVVMLSIWCSTLPRSRR
jgi:hypothetical protein